MRTNNYLPSFNNTPKEVKLNTDRYIIKFGDFATVNFSAIGYNYDSVDLRNKDAMPLVFTQVSDAKKYIDDIINIARRYSEKIKNSVNHSKAFDDAKYELEKITSTNRSIIVWLIMDLTYNTGKNANCLGLYDYQYCIVPKEDQDYIYRQYKKYGKLDLTKPMEH